MQTQIDTHERFLTILNRVLAKPLAELPPAYPPVGGSYIDAPLFTTARRKSSRKEK